MKGVVTGHKAWRFPVGADERRWLFEEDGMVRTDGDWQGGQPRSRSSRGTRRVLSGGNRKYWGKGMGSGSKAVD